MKKHWSISTTVRNPERLRGFLDALSQLEGQEFDRENQVKFQTLLIQERLYNPTDIPPKLKMYFEDSTRRMPFGVAEKIFHAQRYKDPPMRGRQSANPLNKLGFAVAREGAGPIRVTELGKKLLKGDGDIGFVFFKSLLKLQFPNPWSVGFSKKAGFNVAPLVATLMLISRLNARSKMQGLSKREFSIFVPTLIHYSQVDKSVGRIVGFREAKNKELYVRRFLSEFYGVRRIPEKMPSTLFDYGDNIMRYFRLTRYFKVVMDPLGQRWHVDLEPSRKTEIEQLLSEHKGNALEFKRLEDYLDYLSDIAKPQLPWEELDNLRGVVLSVREVILQFIEREKIHVENSSRALLEKRMETLAKDQLNEYLTELRALNLILREQVNKAKLIANREKVAEIIRALNETKILKKYEPEQFEKLIVDALRILNDEIKIKPNYLIDDEGEPIGHAPGNRADVECFYKSFSATCEVTLNTTKLQWVQEGQPVMRHLRDFETQHGRSREVYCIFIAPQIHRDTLSTFWMSVKYEYDGLPQKIIPMTTEQFAVLLKTLLDLRLSGRMLSHGQLFALYRQIIDKTHDLSGFSDWASYISDAIENWRRKMVST
ncbi:MAG: AlwI family type II restriction endonuclease [Candidatus Omnitrophica bacterium]|nr:AlwI family type II restriction endonuclease [Candidatus Omnitrophota bacterium]